ncbi:hypothetical protein HMPREF9597_02497 [Cutibacterium acnes HL005PA4]|nr:hypothetical protein HMPREF9575_00895 [Cutibacterium acnes HL110PA1]EFS78273.1 hypothetical protein HMPREF9597_02497 [Cutibacterium acnes HL005PA4]EFS81597.1 hypothetical protein HMPREF9598_01816 [Cutibacterium acnes HL050PA1]EFT19715.1 hypothetical protein HMPREF9566_02588 [Cutibacterium acnes HL045PA1]EFT30256.1 hypothetical protein HMPREF9595_02475 [Cutibacterium acnes HL005PA2]EFT32867.1 hypothetical protein HMPREF9596_02353 [Cutibacterium acnes HL005PA3]EGF70007.1 hypothetical protein
MRAVIESRSTTMTAAISHTVDADLRAASMMMCRLCCLRMLGTC